MRVDARRRRRIAGTIAGLAGIAIAALPFPDSEPAGGADDPFPEMAGSDTSLPLTDSKVTVEARGAFEGMEITINQTEDLTNQAISITWRNAPPTESVGADTFFANYLQVMQCWGEPDDLVPENPGPPPENCVWGALNPTATSHVRGFPSRMATGRNFAHEEWPDFEPGAGTIDDEGNVYRDFVAVDGTVVTKHVDNTASGPFDRYWLNSYFDSVKTNELAGARTLSDGTGQALFTVNTGVESSGLGCGQRVEASATGGEPTVPRCWLVIVPRGTAEAENAGTPFHPSQGVSTSPMQPASWRNRVAIELEFIPVDSPCDIAADQRLIGGTELAVGAVTSWQPVLCSQPGRLPFAYGIVSDQLARQQLRTGGPGSPGMIAVNEALPADASTPEDPVVYAPLAVSSVVIGFNVERVRKLDTRDASAQGLRYDRINLTPRLVAKLLTQSYRSQVEILGSKPYDWDDDNPSHMLVDPDFLQFNPEFTLWQSGAIKEAGGLILPGGTSDYARQVWEWVLADPEAAAWLAGEPDEFGMVVNPVYATTEESNSTGFAFASPAPDSFPKSDPYCYGPDTLDSGVEPPQLCGLDWSPYAGSLADAAGRTAAAYDQSKTTLNRFAGTVEDVWQRTEPQGLGSRTVFSVTDLRSTERFGLQAARLSRPGDNGAEREFVAPDAPGLSRAVLSMSEEESGTLRLDPKDIERGAYPLANVIYAAIRPAGLDEAARADYAALLDHAAGSGQVPGHELGQLPPGYLPLPGSLKLATSFAAEQVRTFEPPDDEPTTTTTATTSTTVASAPTTTPPTTAAPPSRGGITSPRTQSPPTTSVAVPSTSPVATTPDSQPTSTTVIRQMTPVSSIGNGRFAVVGVAVAALLSALVFLEITKSRPRRRGVAAPPASPA